MKSIKWLALSVVAASLSISAQAAEVTGAGASFPAPIYAKWADAYQKATSNKINYQSIGSGGGIKQITAKTVDFGASDMPLKAEALDKDGLVQFPTVIGGVVPVVNLADIKPGQLKLTGAVLADIYLGKILKWNDKALVELNPGLKLPDQDIGVVRRADGSGTTFIFSNYLSKVSPEWKQKVGEGTAVQWPVGLGGKGNEGVSAFVMRLPGSIGYVEYAYAKQNKLTYTAMINKAGKTVVPNAASVESSMNDFATAFTPKLTATIVDGAGEASYPITGYTYLILHTTSMTDCVKAGKLLDYINWSLTDAGAAKVASDLGYSVLPGAIRDQVLAKLGEVSCNGSPVMKK